MHLTVEKELEYGVKYAEDAINADMAYINSEEYAKKFKNITSNDAVNQAILDCSRKAIEHWTGTLYEDMYLINGNTGEIVGSQTSSKEIQKVDYNESLNNAIIRAREENFPIIALHNHPEGYPRQQHLLLRSNRSWVKKDIEKKSRFKSSPEHQPLFTDTFILSLRNKVKCDFTQNIEI